MTTKKKLIKKDNTSIDRGKDNPKELVVQEMTLVAPDRTAKDIGKLQSAVKRSESIHLPNRSALYDIYHDIISMDGHLEGLIQKRIGAVLNKTLKYVDKNKEKVDAFDTLIYSNKFNTLIKLLIESKLWGVSGVEFIVGQEFDFKAVPRKHIRPEQGIITLSQYSNTGIPIKDLPFVWIVGEPDDLGILLRCAMYALYKRSGFGDFAQFVEIFGQPVRIIYYDAYDTKTKGELRKLLNESGSSLAMMIPKQAQFQMLDGKTSNGTGDLQINFINACKEEMSVAVLGNSETTTSSSSSGYAQSKEHSKQQLEITKSDLAFVQNILNEPQFISILKSYGFPVAEGGAFEFEMEIDLETLAKRLAIDMQISEKVPIADDYWYFTYGIPKPKNYEELKKQQELWRRLKEQAQKVESEEVDNDTETDVEPEEKPKEKKQPEKKELKALDIIFTSEEKGILQRGWELLFGAKKKVNVSEYYGTMETCPCCGGHKHEFPDLIGSEALDNIYEDIARKLLNEKLAKGDIHPDLYLETARQLMNGVSEGLGGSSFSYDDSRNVLQTYLRRNIYHFSAAKNLTELMIFRDAMVDEETGDILSQFEFKKKIRSLGIPFNEVWLDTEHDTALSTAINAHRFDSIDSEYLEFTTVGDERVSPEHALLDKLTYPKNHQIWYKLTPPLRYKCRCGLKPGLARNYKPNNSEKDERYVGGLVKDTIFDNNAGKTRLIFDNKHPYYANLPKGKTKQLSASNYGLPSIETIRNRGGLKPLSLLDDKENFEEYWKKMVNDRRGLVLESPLGEKILFSDYELTKSGKRKNAFKQHISERRDAPERYKLLANLQEVISKPDEIWSLINENKPNQPPTTHYIKYYEGKTLVALTIENEGRTIFELDEVGFRTRHGLLLYKK